MKRQSGFSAVELLITLFIASAFLIAGYQIWGFVQKSSADSQQFAKASNLAYDYMRRYAIGTPACSAGSPPTPPASPNITPQPTVEGLNNSTLTVAYSCPIAGTPTITAVTATVTYGSNPQKSVTHAIYVQSQ